MGGSQLSKIRILQEDCDVKLADDKSLPNTCFVVEYYKDDAKKYDLVISTKKVDIFDHYWDKYNTGFITMYQSAGTANPKLWNAPGSEPKEKKKK